MLGWVAAFLIATWSLSLGVASAQPADWPAKPIRLVSPFNPGGAIDVLNRLIAERLSARLGHQVIVDARPGANTIIGAEIVARAPADGYTFPITTSAGRIKPLAMTGAQRAATMPELATFKEQGVEGLDLICMSRPMRRLAPLRRSWRACSARSKPCSPSPTCARRCSTRARPR
jgi:tripartite-type tricarboxylate transporter receptor subunit TctC